MRRHLLSAAALLGGALLLLGDSAGPMCADYDELPTNWTYALSCCEQVGDACETVLEDRGTVVARKVSDFVYGTYEFHFHSKEGAGVQYWLDVSWDASSCSDGGYGDAAQGRGRFQGFTLGLEAEREEGGWLAQDCVYEGTDPEGEAVFSCAPRDQGDGPSCSFVLSPYEP